MDSELYMDQQLGKILESNPVEASAPCRIDMGGTLDISTFSYPLRYLAPCTFNIALGLRTRIRLKPYARGRIKISSKGFKDAQFPADAAPFDHPLGLMFATAAYFNARGIQIEIHSQSPPRSALGGSSVAAVASADPRSRFRGWFLGGPASLARVFREPCSRQRAGVLGGAPDRGWSLARDLSRRCGGRLRRP